MSHGKSIVALYGQIRFEEGDGLLTGKTCLTTQGGSTSQPTIRKPDKSKLFQDQERITTEHQLNLFIDKNDLGSYGMEFEMNLPINFSGIVERYTRKNGTEDYGIYPTIDSTLHTKLNLVAAITEKLSERPTYTPQEYL